MLQVLLHRSGTHAEEVPDLGIALTLGHPAEHLGLSRGKAPEPAKRLLRQRPGIWHPLHPALPQLLCALPSAQWEAGVALPPLHRIAHVFP